MSAPNRAVCREYIDFADIRCWTRHDYKNYTSGRAMRDFLERNGVPSEGARVETMITECMRLRNEYFNPAAAASGTSSPLGAPKPSRLVTFAPDVPQNPNFEQAANNYPYAGVHREAVPGGHFTDAAPNSFFSPGSLTDPRSSVSQSPFAGGIPFGCPSSLVSSNSFSSPDSFADSDSSLTQSAPADPSPRGSLAGHTSLLRSGPMYDTTSPVDPVVLHNRMTYTSTLPSGASTGHMARRRPEIHPHQLDPALETLKSMDGYGFASDVLQPYTGGHHISAENAPVAADNVQEETDVDKTMRENLEFFMAL